MGRVFGSAVQGGFDEGRFLFGGDLLWAARARPIFQNTGQPFGLVASPPQQHRRQRRRQLAGQPLIGDTFGGTQTPERDRLRSASQLADLKQLLTFTLSQRQRGERQREAWPLEYEANSSIGKDIYETLD
jgi:hypothetical protein